MLGCIEYVAMGPDTNAACLAFFSKQDFGIMTGDKTVFRFRVKSWTVNNYQALLFWLQKFMRDLRIPQAFTLIPVLR